MKNLPVTFILITVVIDSMGIGLIMPVMPELIKEVEGADLSTAAVWGGVLATVFAAMQFLFGPTVGSLSDRFGRRPVLLFSLVIMAFDYVLMAVAGTIWLLIIGRIIGGITAATQATSAAYMADISRPEDKAANFGLIGAAFGVGFVLGPLLGGVLAELGTRAPFWAAAFLAAANAVFGYYVLPETVTDRIRRPFLWRRANPLGAFTNIGKLPGLNRLMLITFVYTVAFFVYPGVWAYFGVERFGWSPGMIGLSLAIFGIGIAIVQGFLIKPIMNRIGERNTVIFGLLIDVCAFVALGFVTNGWIALALTPLTALGSVAGPALQGIMSRTASDDQQGELQGTVTSINAVATIVAPLIVTQTFWYFTAPENPYYLPGAPFLLSALLTIGCVLVFIQTPHPAKPRVVAP
ncbi:TCR/Tet family MFS transporter [Yoonia sediminilitoris]|uniref:DHA1 family tetracycline resistance protein-like MFS transporter n=1 Tax=Yoonia sediminilitoris TaxID=1286148 RepID=A0A2T6KBE0_9RHOB|nr:TCR/Tet family MFS transporter [Yoonia sediminilitoris]PUB12137.1 DHA1 family tetracycline resistance protein-like MFS transporter [Yoonia sediminilitoris]RCW92964.1 DHA1 family tetracycline resistance protein-like MFS transporter [Yoonia sediminilitoris]